VNHRDTTILELKAAWLVVLEAVMAMTSTVEPMPGKTEEAVYACAQLEVALEMVSDILTTLRTCDA
jgi:hypothetical protein